MKETLFINIIDGKIISIHSTNRIDDDNLDIYVADHTLKTATKERINPINDGVMIGMLNNAAPFEEL